MSNALFHALLQVGDDNLILAQRLCEWSGRGPTIEVDLSLSNIALDLIGQATLLLDLAGTVEGAGRDADRLAFHRDAEQFRNCLMVEQPNGDFAQTIARLFFFATYSKALLEQLAQCSDDRVADIAAKALKEVRYHAEFAREWLIRLGDGTEESRIRMIAGVEWHWRFIDDVFTTSPIADVEVASLRPAFDQTVAQALAAATLPQPAATWPITGGRDGRHSEHLSLLLATMQVLPRAHPEAVW